MMNKQTGARDEFNKEEFGQYLDQTKSKIKDEEINAKIDSVKDALKTDTLIDDQKKLMALEEELTEKRIKGNANLSELKEKITGLKASIESQKKSDETDVPVTRESEMQEPTAVKNDSFNELLGDSSSSVVDKSEEAAENKSENGSPTAKSETSQKGQETTEEVPEDPLEALKLDVLKSKVSQEDLDKGLKVLATNKSMIEAGADESAMTELSNYDILSAEAKKAKEGGPLAQFMYMITKFFNKLIGKFTGEKFSDYDVGKLKFHQRISRYLNSLGFGDDRDINNMLGKVKDTKFKLVSDMMKDNFSDEDIANKIIENYNKRLGGLSEAGLQPMSRLEQKSLIRVVKFIKANTHYRKSIKPPLNEDTTIDFVVQSLFTDQTDKSYAMPKENVVILDFAVYQDKGKEIPAFAAVSTPRVKADDNTKVKGVQAKAALAQAKQEPDEVKNNGQTETQTVQTQGENTATKPPATDAFVTEIRDDEVADAKEDTETEDFVNDQEFIETYGNYNDYRDPKIETAIKGCAKIPFVIKYIDDIAANEAFIKRAKSLGLDYPDVVDFDKGKVQLNIGDHKYGIKLKNRSNGNSGMLKKTDDIQLSFKLNGGRFQVYNKAKRVEDLDITKDGMIRATFELLNKGSFDYGEKYGYEITFIKV